MASATSTTSKSTTASKAHSRKKSKKTRTDSITLQASDVKLLKSSKRLRHGLSMCNYEDLPDWQQDNECIVSGYIQATNSFTKCLHSLGVFHNESVNIYTHLLPSVTYFVMLIIFTDLILEQQILKYIKANPAQLIMDSIDYIMINFYLVGAFLCLFCSSFFHTFKQHSKKYSDMCSKADYMGIIILITCSIISLLYYGFHDHLFIFKIFTIITSVMGSVCSVFVLHDKFNSKNFKVLRASFFVLFGFSGMIPILFGIFKFGIQESLRRVQLFYVILEAFFYIGGAIIYGFRIPECFFPGRFDFLGHSHQIFHVMVVMGSLCHFRAVIGSFVLAHAGIHNHRPFIF
ncbi:hypothetical protein ACO0RG_001428 [Hanseniaspora osmophila]